MPESIAPAPHTHRVTLLIAFIALLLTAYALWRVDNTRDRQDALRDAVAKLEAANTSLRSELQVEMERDAKARAELQQQWQQLAELPQQVKDLTAAHEDLRARTERPQRAWNRAEALYLIELAQRRLNFDHDVTTAIAALESADSRLASLRDASLDVVRERIAKDLQALRAVPEPDRAGIVTRLVAVESQVTNLPLKGILVGQRMVSENAGEASSWLARAWSAVTATFERMFVVRRIDTDHTGIVSFEEQSLRRQHLALLIYSARNAAIRGDEVAYRASLEEAATWLRQYFMHASATDSAASEIAVLQQINISPPVPDISAAVKMLSRVSSQGAP